MKLILDERFKLTNDEVKTLEDLGYEIKYYNETQIEGDVFVGMLRAPFSQLENIKGLKYIQSTIVGYENIDMDNLSKLKITYANASGVSSGPIAEYVVLKILDHYKQSAKFRRQQADKVWGTHSENSIGILELENKRVMVLGTGHIGQAISQRLSAFNAVMVGVNSDGRSVDGFEETYALSDVYKHLKDVDVVVGALPLNKYTDKLYAAKFFDAMATDAIFINVGRGPQLVESDAIAALDKLGAIYLDVTPNEPLERDSALWSHPKVSITPHISASADLVKARTKQLVLTNLENYIKGQPLVNRVI